MLKEEDDHDWSLEKPGSLKYIAGIDISYSKTNSQNACAALLILSFPSMEVIYEDYEQETTEYPYVPGFLAFKEVPVYTILFNRLKTNRPEIWPQLMLVDGNGILHTRNLGAASHCGVLFDIPSIGVGKTVFAVDGITQRNVNEECKVKLLKKGDLFELKGNSGKVWGLALRATD
jgi:endonuclease V